MSVRDAASLKHRIPQDYLPYLEKKCIYNFFYDITVAYALNQPEDHVLFLRNYLCKLHQKSDFMKILIIGSPHINLRALAEEIAEALNLLLISVKDIQGKEPVLKNQPQHPTVLANNLKNFIEDHSKNKSGWILFDFPRYRLEARAMHKLAINPTHTFQLVPSSKFFTKRDLWNENLINKDPKQFKELLYCYKRRLVELKYSFADTIKEIVIRGRTLHQVAKSIIILAKQDTSKTGPTLPRVVVLGEMSKKVEYVIKEVCRQLNLKFINMDEVICQGKHLDSDVGKKIRELEKHNVQIYGRIVIALIQNRLMSIDCLNEGWILINFPRDRADFEALDTFDITPNRIIFLLPTDKQKRELFRDKVILEPRDYGDEILEDVCKLKSPSEIPSSEKVYTSMSCRQIRDLLEYCGEHCKFIDPTMTKENLIEAMTKIILDPLVCAKPRVPTTKEEFFEQLTKQTEPSETLSSEICPVDERLKDRLQSPSKVLTEKIDDSISNSEIVTESKKSSSKIILDEEGKSGKSNSSCTSVFPWKLLDKRGVPDKLTKLFEEMKESGSSDYDVRSISSN